MAGIACGSTSARGVGEKRHLASPLDGDRHLTLVPAAGTGDAPRADLAPLRDVAAQLVHVLVVDLIDLLFAEVAVAPPDRRLARARTPARPLLLLSVFSRPRHQKGMSSSAAGAKSASPSAPAAAGTNCG